MIITYLTKVNPSTEAIINIIKLCFKNHYTINFL